ncbi:MAG: hypothetical protein IT559_07445 [Alphaproteobacteria bacterium]|nr:hypothetical protein [Alphaproteobacteria bacterium]
MSVKMGDKSEKAKKTAGDGISRPLPGVADFLAGEAKSFVSNLTPYLPQELVGGAIPHIPGQEDEAVWNAASQACGTEKVHYCYAAEGGRIWYLACPSSSMASNPDSWCPLAAALPGNSEYWDRETVYLYEQEGLASALRWDPETGRMQVFLGASRSILPRVQSMDANFATINPEIAEIVPWRNRMLNTEKLARATVRMLVLSGMLVSVLAALVLAYNYIAINLTQRNLSKVAAETEKASTDLMIMSYNAMKSDTIKHMVRVQEILDGLGQIDSTLVRYDVKGSAVQWEALVPAAYIPTAVQRYSVKVDETRKEKDGRIRVVGTF